MSTMIERVVAAMISADSGPEGSTLFVIHKREFGDGYRSSALAAIEAMREPTEEMVNAAEAFRHAGGQGYSGIYQAMIDAALREETP